MCREERLLVLRAAGQCCCCRSLLLSLFIVLLPLSHPPFLFISSIPSPFSLRIEPPWEERNEWLTQLVLAAVSGWLAGYRRLLLTSLMTTTSNARIMSTVPWLHNSQITRKSTQQAFHPTASSFSCNMFVGVAVGQPAHPQS